MLQSVPKTWSYWVYNPSGKLTEFRADATFVKFSVHDTGIGISPTQQQVIFEAFRQADGSTSRRYGGTCLGLSISRRIVGMMGGELHVDSQPGHGSTFSFTVRLKANTSETGHCPRHTMSRAG